MTFPTPAVLDTLLARVRAATEPNGLLDEAIWHACGYVREMRQLDDSTTNWRNFNYCWYSPAGEFCFGPAELPAVTASLDAITALIASRGLGWQVDETEGATVSDEHDQWHETCATPVLSLVGAWLVAEMERAEEA